MTTKPKNPDKIDKNVRREERLNEALRANLQKRKQQGRKRTQSDKSPELS